MAKNEKRTTELSCGMPTIIMKSGKLLYITHSPTSMQNCSKLYLRLVQRWWLIRGIFLCEGGDMEMGNSMAGGSEVIWFVRLVMDIPQSHIDISRMLRRWLCGRLSIFNWVCRQWYKTALEERKLIYWRISWTSTSSN